MKRLTLTATCFALSTATLLTAACYRDKPELVKVSRNEAVSRLNR